MQWTLFSHPANEILEYRLFDKNKVALVLKFHPVQQTLRIICNDIQRLFMMQNSGSGNNKTIFKNEYGVEVGKLSYDKWYSNNGTLELDGRKYHHASQFNETEELVIYKNDKDHPLISAHIPGKATTAVPVEFEHTILLLGLCWLLMLPVMENKIPSLSVA